MPCFGGQEGGPQRGRGGPFQSLFGRTFVRVSRPFEVSAPVTAQPEPAAPQPPAQAAGKTPGKTDYNVPPETFIAVWQTSASAMEVAKRLNMPKDIVHARASTYRQAGIKLKKMPRHRTKALDVERSNQIIEEIDRQKGGQVVGRQGKNSSSLPHGDGGSCEKTGS